MGRSSHRFALVAFGTVSAVVQLLIFTQAGGRFSENLIRTYRMARAGWWSDWYSPVHPLLLLLVLGRRLNLRSKTGEISRPDL